VRPNELGFKEYNDSSNQRSYCGQEELKMLCSSCPVSVLYPQLYLWWQL